MRAALLLPVLALTTPPAQAQELLHELTSTGEKAGYFGQSVSAVPDVDGDGRTDLLVGAHGEGDGGYTYTEPGRVHLFSGASGDLLYTLASPNEEDNSYFGYSVSGVPDADGDGWGDLLAGAHLEDPGTSPALAGRAYVFSGATGTLLHELAVPDERAYNYFGDPVSGVGDVDGDGRGDVLVTARGAESDTTLDGAGRVYVFSGATGVLLHELASPNEEWVGFFGYATAGVPDVDGDGLTDVLIGTPYEDPGASPDYAGRAYVFSGASGDLLYELKSPNEEEWSCFGRSVSGIPDVDGDGRGDLLIAATQEDTETGPEWAGRVYVFSGATGVLLHTLVSPNEDEGGRFGWSVSGAQDGGGDGQVYLVVGTPYENPDPSPSEAGRVYVFSGNAGELLHALPSPNEEGGGYFGQSVAGVEDADGGGHAGFIVGAWGEDPGTSPDDAGRAYLFSLGGEVTASEPSLPLSVALNVPRPTPFSTRTALGYALPELSPVRLSVYDVLGREVAVLVDEEVSAGRHEVTLDGARLSAGTYLVRLEVGGEAHTQRLTLAR